MANLDRAPCEGHKEQQDTPLEAQKATKSQRIPTLKARSGKMGAPKALNGGREAKMKAQKAKRTGNESPQSQNGENQRPKGQKLEN